MTTFRPSLRRRLIAAIAILVATLGVTLVGQGAWIYAKAALAQVLLERAFTQTLASGSNVKPWPWADTWPVARIEVPRLHLSEIALAGSSGQALAFGPGHLEFTPEPGEPGTSVFSAHRDTHFAFMKDVAVGDEIRVTRRDGAQFRYRVTHMAIARADGADIDLHSADREIVLTTCWPLGAKFSGPLRYLVYARLDDNIVGLTR